MKARAEIPLQETVHQQPTCLKQNTLYFALDNLTFASASRNSTMTQAPNYRKSLWASTAMFLITAIEEMESTVHKEMFSYKKPGLQQTCEL